MSDEVKISLVLKHLMKSKKLTFKKLGQLSNVAESTIKTWSAGIEPKSLSHARKVARALDVSVEFLVFGETSVQTPRVNELLTTHLFSGWYKVTIEIPVTSSNLTEKE